MVRSAEQMTLKPVGVVKAQASDNQIKKEHKEVEAVVEIFPEFEEALEGLDGYSHLFLLSYFHKLRHDQIGPLKVEPKRATRRGFKLEELPTVGVFTLDSPTRPNPIGLTLVRLIKGKAGSFLLKESICSMAHQSSTSSRTNLTTK